MCSFGDASINHSVAQGASTPPAGPPGSACRSRSSSSARTTTSASRWRRPEGWIGATLRSPPRHGLLPRRRPRPRARPRRGGARHRELPTPPAARLPAPAHRAPARTTPAPTSRRATAPARRSRPARPAIRCSPRRGWSIDGGLLPREEVSAWYEEIRSAGRRGCAGGGAPAQARDRGGGDGAGRTEPTPISWTPRPGATTTTPRG